MFFIGTAQFPLPFRCVLSFGRAAVAVPRGRYAVRSGVRFAAFGGAVRRTFRSGFRTGQGQRVPRRVSVSGARGRAGGAAVIPVPANAWAWLYGAARGKGRPAVPFRRIGVRSWPKRFSCAVRGGRGLLETGFPGRVSPGVRGTRSFPQTVLLRPAPRFVMPGRRTPFVAGPYRAARSGAPAAPDRRVKRPVPSFGSCVSGPAGSFSRRSPPGRSVSRTGAGERQGEGRGPRFFACGPPECGSFRKRHYICTVQEPICRIENEAFVRIYRMVLPPLCRAVAFGVGLRSVRRPFGRGRCPLRKPLRGVRSARMVPSGRRVVAVRRASPRGRRARFFRGGGRAPSALPGTGRRSGGSSPSFSYGTSGRPARCTAPRQGPYAGRACPVGPLCAGAA